MKHSHRLELGAVSIRPAEINDSEFILKLRTDPERSKFLGTFDVTLEQQKNWMTKYFDDPSDYYFIIEFNSRPVGTVGLYNIRIGEGNTDAEWGRWVVCPDVHIGTVEAFLIMSFAFDVLKIKFLYWQTVAENIAVVKFHDFYAKQIPKRNSNVLINGIHPEMVFHGMSADEWCVGRKKLGHLARLVAKTE